MYITGSCITAYVAILFIEGFRFDGALAWSIIVALLWGLSYFIKAEDRKSIAALAEKNAADLRNLSEKNAEDMKALAEKHSQALKEMSGQNTEAINKLGDAFREYRHDDIAPWQMEVTGRIDQNEWTIKENARRITDVSGRLDKLEARMERYEHAAFRHHGERIT